MPDYDDPSVEELWCKARRSEVAEYLKRQKVQHGRIGEWPAWHVAPYVSLWAIESLRHPDSVGWWVICGDLPTDYVSASEIDHPREALRAIADEWREQAQLMDSRERPDDIRIGGPEDWATLAPMLESRALMLLKFADDDAHWQET